MSTVDSRRAHSSVARRSLLHHRRSTVVSFALTGLRGQLQATLGDCYSIERDVGGGGMSRVFVSAPIRLEA